MQRIEFLQRSGLLAIVLAAVLCLNVSQAEPFKPIEVGNPVRIEVVPKNFVLCGVREKLQLIVTGHYAHGEVRDLTRRVEFTSGNEGVAIVQESIVYPKQDGSSAIVIRAGNQEAIANIEVQNQSKPQPVSFRYDTLAALSKQGCNAGACHGSPSGKGGFRMSLRAFDAKLDEYTLINEEYGRRANPLDPESSLLLQKPLMKVAHGGGMKIRTKDPAYKVLRDWIGEGCRVEPKDSPRCTGIQVLPGSKRVLKSPALRQQLAVLASFSDGSVRDVTDLAVYSSSDMTVASVNESGLVVGQDRGESAIIVRYLEFIESTFLTFVQDIDNYQWNEPPVNNYIDNHVHQKLKQLKYLPSEICTDEEFLRRVYLDIVGLLPNQKEVESFLSDPSSDKRATLIDELLERPEHAKFWTLKWGDLLRMTSGQVGNKGVHKYHRWVENAIRSNMPYDEFARQLLTASGSTFDNPPANFYRTSNNTNERVETISQIFLGARLQCAKCHNHPFERWTQDNYYGMGAFFHRVQTKKTRRPDELFVWSSTSGEVKQPRTGETMKPWVPVAGVLGEADPIDHRITFADWLTSQDNPFFAKIEVNRIWSHLLGRGIVDPPDDFRDSNPPSNGQLLDALAKDFIEHGFDRRYIISTILKSRTYQMSHRPNDFNRSDTKYFSHYRPRLLSAEQLLDAICHVTGIAERFQSLPASVKATQLPAPDLVNHDFLKIFGQPERQTVCQCERTTESNLGMAIQFLNGPLIHNKVRDAKNRFRKLVESGQSDEQIITTLNLVALSRAPTRAELKAGLDHLQNKQQQYVVENANTEKQITEVDVSISKLHAGARQQLEDQKIKALPEAIRADTRDALTADAEKRTAIQKYLVEKLGPEIKISDEEVTKQMPEPMKKQLAELKAKKTALTENVKSPAQVRIIGLEDICWVVLNRNEFLFNH